MQAIDQKYRKNAYPSPVSLRTYTSHVLIRISYTFIVYVWGGFGLKLGQIVLIIYTLYVYVRQLTGSSRLSQTLFTYTIYIYVLRILYTYTNMVCVSRYAKRDYYLYIRYTYKYMYTFGLCLPRYAEGREVGLLFTYIIYVYVERRSSGCLV